MDLPKWETSTVVETCCISVFDEVNNCLDVVLKGVVGVVEEDRTVIEVRLVLADVSSVELVVVGVSVVFFGALVTF